MMKPAAARTRFFRHARLTTIRFAGTSMAATFDHRQLVAVSTRVLRFCASVAGVAAITFAALKLVPVNAATVGFMYLLYVLIIASTWGFIEAAAASIAAALVFNFYFFPPLGTLSIADPQNWIALTAFLSTSIIASRLSAAAKRREVEAIQRQQHLERLYSLGRAILLINSGEPFAKQLVTRVADTFELTAAAIYDPRSGNVYRAGPADLDGIDHHLREAAVQGTAFSDPQRKLVITAIRLGSEPIAGLALEGIHTADSVLQSIANLVAIGLERAKAQELANEVEAARRSEQLRDTLIDAMAHEFKTPLTAIRAATTALLADPSHPPKNATQMLQIADEEAAHLEELIDNALDSVRLDAQRIELKLVRAGIGAAVRQVIASMQTSIGDRRVEFACDDNSPAIPFDERLIRLALKQVLDNALKYSRPETPIEIRLVRADDSVAVEVTDHGKGISAQEQSRIFERFYRSPSVQDHIPGSGLGLSIAERILRAHGGTLRVSSEPGNTTFTLLLPIRSTVYEERRGL